MQQFKAKVAGKIDLQFSKRCMHKKILYNNAISKI